MTMETWIEKMVDFENKVGNAEIDCRKAIQELGNSPASEVRDVQIDVVVASVKRIATDIVGFTEWIETVGDCIKESDRCSTVPNGTVGQYEDSDENKVKTPWDPTD